VIVFAGPNGAGKSGLPARYRVRDRLPIVNANEIAAEISPPGRRF
jgi:predicted ABC-type ATPase